MKWFWQNKKADEQRAINDNAGFGLSFTNLSGYLNKNALTVSSFFAAVEKISNIVSSLPIKVIVAGEDGKNEMKNHPVKMSLNNGFISKFALFKAVVSRVILKGNAYIYIVRAADGTVTGLKLIDDVSVFYNERKNTLYYKSATIKRGNIEPCDMLHFKMWSNDGINGVSLLAYASRSLGISNASEDAAKSFFNNGLNVNGLLKSSVPINAKQRDEIRSAWNTAYNGNGGGLVILPQNLDYEKLQLSPSDSQLLESRRFNISDIARFFSMDPVFIGGESSASYSNLESMKSSFYTNTIAPWIVMLEDELNKKLLKPSEDKLEIIFDTVELLRADKAAQANYYKIMVDAGILSRNEVREQMGLSPFEGGDSHSIAYSDAEKSLIN